MYIFAQHNNHVGELTSTKKGVVCFPFCKNVTYVSTKGGAEQEEAEKEENREVRCRGGAKGGGHFFFPFFVKQSSSMVGGQGMKGGLPNSAHHGHADPGGPPQPHRPRRPPPNHSRRGLQVQPAAAKVPWRSIDFSVKQLPTCKSYIYRYIYRHMHIHAYA